MLVALRVEGFEAGLGFAQRWRRRILLGACRRLVLQMGVTKGCWRQGRAG